MLKIKSRRQRDPAEINLASTADIAFLLIVFFLAASALLEFHGVSLPLPVKDAPPMQLLKENLFKISVNAQSEILFANRKMALKDLEKELKESFAKNQELVAIVRISGQAQSELLPILVKSIENAGIKRISVGMDP